MRWVVRGTVPVIVGVGAFLLLDPLILWYPDKFRSDIKNWVVDPLTGATKPIWVAQFSDVASPPLYWFTNLLWWGVGPALEIAGMVGIAWLIVRRDRKSFVAAGFAILYYVAAAMNNRAPFIRYVLPLCPALAIGAAVLCADWSRIPRVRVLARAAAALVAGSTLLYALAYMNVFRQPDARLAASKWLLRHVPADAAILVEPSQNTPPMGTYLSAPDFNRDHVRWADRNGHGERHDYYRLFTIDMYRFVYNPGRSDQTRSDYIAARLGLADYIVIDDTFVQFYQHLPESAHRVAKQYYADLFAGRLGFRLVETFKVYPSILGVVINDDAAEMTFRLFDHPRVLIFQRASP